MVMPPGTTEPPGTGVIEPTAPTVPGEVAKIRGRSLGQIAWMRLKRDKVAMSGAGVVIFLIVVAVFAPVVVRLFGHDLRDYRLADLRNQFALVLQDAVLFSGTLAENIAYARPGATAQEIEAAARAACAHDFIARLPDGPYSKKFAYDAKSMFTKPDSAKLKNQKQLNEAGHFLEENRFGLAVVAAYSGMKGDSDEERQLTQARAAVVRDYLVQNFKVDDTRIKTVGVGKSAGIENGSTVEVLIYPAGTNVAVAGDRSHAARAKK